MAINYKAKITELLEASNLFYSLWNIPFRKPHRVCISDDKSMSGNAWGKVVIGANTWREVFEILQSLSLTPDMIAGRKLHEVPDNDNGKIVALTNIEYDFDDGMGDAPETLATKMVVVIPSTIKNSADAENFLSDYITEKSNWCHFGFTIVPQLNTLYTK
jgi:hypothetical protein